MIVSLRGTLDRWDGESSSAWIEVGGIGHDVLIPAFAHDWIAAQPIGEELKLFTYYHVSERQPAPLLIGFQHHQEREFFRKFINVPEVGPQKAVKALTHPVSDIARWIEAEDHVALRQLPGIGQRLSQTIVANLHGKLTQEALLRSAGAASPAQAATNALYQDAVDALESLQYSHREAEQLVTGTLREQPDIVGLEDLLRAVLEQQAPV
jgi:Holliday junction DNA helicase RuvA